MEALLASSVTGLPASSCVHYNELKVSSSVAGLQSSYRRSLGAEVRATGRNGKPGGIGSGRRRRGTPRKDQKKAETDTTLPFLEPCVRIYKEEGHQALEDVEYLLLRATNPYGLVLEISEGANEYLRNHKEDSLLRKPVLKMISDRINEAAGEQLTDSYIDDHPDYENIVSTFQPQYAPVYTARSSSGSDMVQFQHS